MAGSYAKWACYYGSGRLPWDSGRPSSQLLQYLTGCCVADQDSGGAAAAAGAAEQPADVDDRAYHLCASCLGTTKPAGGARAMELGCGTGSSCVALALAGFRVVGVDVVAEAVDTARARAAGAGVSQRCTFLQLDVYTLPRSLPAEQRGPFSLVYDCQCFHALRAQDGSRDASFQSVVWDLLRPAGFYMLLTGNDCEPAVGPTTMSLDQIRAAFPAPRWRTVWARQTRFDATPFYSTLPQCPLAWWVLLQKQEPGCSA